MTVYIQSALTNAKQLKITPYILTYNDRIKLGINSKRKQTTEILEYQIYFCMNSGRNFLILSFEYK